jgi:putative Mg2+ transporter-C (MgtC) family protein
MTLIDWQALGQLAAAWAAGGVVGLERSYHGRAAGFRTHALVGLAAAAAVSVCMAPSFLPGAFESHAARLDPTRLVQGVMTGIGFLGAGVIFKEGVNVQGLTTAASVWATAAVGVLFGVGAFIPAALTTVGILVSLVALRWVENAIPAEVYAWSVFRFRAETAPDGPELQRLLESFGVSLAEVSYARTHEGALLEFRGNLVARRGGAFDRLAAHLRAQANLVEFDLARISK